MADKKKICKECGYFTEEEECINCGATSFAEKHKGKAIIFNAKESKIAEKLNANQKGTYAIKYG